MNRKVSKAAWCRLSDVVPPRRAGFSRLDRKDAVWPQTHFKIGYRYRMHTGIFLVHKTNT